MPDDVLRLRATVVSEEALANIRAIGREIGAVPTRAGKGVEQVNTSFATLGKTIKGVGSELKSAVPTLGAFGLGAAGVGIAARTLISSLGDISSKLVQMKYASKELGLSEQALRAFSSEAQKAGLAPETLMAGLESFKRNTDDFKMRLGSLRGELYAMGAGDFVNRVKASTNQLDALKEAFDFKETLNQFDPSGVKARRFFETIGLGAGAARLSWDELSESMAKKKPLSEVDQAAAKKFNDLLIEMGETWDRLVVKFGVRLMPALTNELGEVNKLIDGLSKLDDWASKKSGKGEQAGSMTSWAAGLLLPGRAFSLEYMMKNPLLGGGKPSGAAPPAAPGGALSPLIAPGPQSGLASGFKPVSFGGFNQGGGGESSGASRIVQIGVFDALVQFKSYAETGSTGGGSGFTNASYSPGGTGGTGGGVDNSPIGRAFRAASTGGTGASGAPAGTTTGGTPGGTSVGGDGTGGSGVPSAFASDVAAMTAAGAKPKDIQQYLSSKGVNVGVATCGQFMAAVVKDHGGTPPQNPAIASSWNTFGGKEGAGYSSDPNAINVAVRQGVATGSTGSHVTAAIPVTDAQGNVTGFRGVGVNQGEGRSVISSHNLKIGTGPGQYQIRHQIPAGAQPAGLPNGQAAGAPRDKRGAALYQKLLTEFQNNPPQGVPPDAARFGITKGTPEEWARFGVSVAHAESGFDPSVKNTSDPGGSFGVFQYAHKQVPGGNAYDVDASVKAFARDANKASVDPRGLRGSTLGRRVSTIGKHPERGAAYLSQAGRIDTANRPPSVNGNVNVTVNSNGTKANAKVNEAGDLYQGTTVKQHKQMQRTEDAGETLSI